MQINEIREKISNALKGRQSPNKGKHPSEEVRNKMNQSSTDNNTDSEGTSSEQ